MTLRETLELLLQMPKPTNEATTRSRMIEPVFEKLGWDKMRGEIELEYEVHAHGRKAGRVDVALLADPARPAIFVEVKRADTELSPRHTEQAIEYAYKTSIPFSVITNGTTWWLYLSEMGGDTRFAELRLDKKSLDQMESDLTAFLSRDALTDGSAQARARQRLEAIREEVRLSEALPRIWSQMRGEPDGTNPDVDLLNLIKNRVYEETGLIAQIKHIVAVITDSAMPQPGRSGLSPPPLEQQDATPHGRDDPRPTGRPSAFELWDELYWINRYYDLLVGVAEAIYKCYPEDFSRIGERRGTRRLWASRNPDELGQPRQVGASGWYINTHMDGPSTERRARQFLEHFGHRPDELRLLYSADDAGASTPRRTPVGAAARSAQSHPKGTATPRRPAGTGSAKTAGKPTGFELWGKRIAVRSFNDIPVGVAQAIYDQNRGDFHRIGELRGRKYAYASQNANDLHQAKPVGTTGWHIDVHFSGPNAIKRARLFLTHFGHDPDDLKLLYGEDAGFPPGQSALPITQDPVTSTHPARTVALAEGETKRQTTGSTRRTPRPSAKPTRFELWGKHYPVSRFNDISVGVAQAIHGRHPHDFHRIGELSGRTRQFASRNPDELFAPKPVGTTDWYIDVNFSGPNAIKRARLFLKHFGYDPDALRLIYD